MKYLLLVRNQWDLPFRPQAVADTRELAVRAGEEMFPGCEIETEAIVDLDKEYRQTPIGDFSIGCDDSYFGYRKAAYQLQEEVKRQERIIKRLKDDLKSLDSTMCAQLRVPKHSGEPNLSLLESADGLRRVTTHRLQDGPIIRTPLKYTFCMTELISASLPTSKTKMRRYEFKGKQCGSLPVFEEIVE